MSISDRSTESVVIQQRNVGPIPLSPGYIVAGINLAILETPMTAQAAEVHKLTLQHTGLHQTRWRAFQAPYATAADPVKKHLPDVMNALDAAEDAAVAMQRAAAQPVAHHYELKAAPAKNE